MKTTHSPKFLKQRRFLTYIPLLITPFVAFLFWILGGGSAAASAEEKAASGLIRNLPDARLNEKGPSDKLMYYENAANDSSKRNELRKYDAYTSSLETGLKSLKPEQDRLSGLAYRGGAYNDSAADQVYRKLEQLDATLKAPQSSGNWDKFPEARVDPQSSRELEKMAQLMKQMEGEKSEDPELSQLQALLDKIQQIQHPELIVPLPNNSVAKVKAQMYQAIPAVISKNQRITQGTVIELRMLDTATLGGQFIPKGHPIHGIAELSNQRLNLRIKNIGLGRAIIPVDLTVFDQKDSMEGIYLPEAVTGEAIRSGSDNALQGLQVLPMDQTVGTQLAGAGITAAKGLFSKKVKLLKGKVWAGYPVLLRNNESE